MALKKSQLYSSLWQSCDELRGGMDASQYKDYVLFMLFIKYISDKYADSDDFAPPVAIPKGASFKDMLELRGIRLGITRATTAQSSSETWVCRWVSSTIQSHFSPCGIASSPLAMSVQ